jgi:hypothetical protein
VGTIGETARGVNVDFSTGKLEEIRVLFPPFPPLRLSRVGRPSMPGAIRDPDHHPKPRRSKTSTRNAAQTRFSRPTTSMTR